MFDAPRSLDEQIRPELEADMRHVHAMAVADDVDDRSLAIVGTAFLETILTQAIAVRLPVLDDVARKTQFDPNLNAPLSSFAAKVHMARAMHAIAGTAYDDLKLIGRIRNSFAHNVRVDSFDHPAVKANSEKLKKQAQMRSFRADCELSVEEELKLAGTMMALPQTPRGKFAHSIASLASGLFNVTVTDAGFGAACLL